MPAWGKISIPFPARGKALGVQMVHSYAILWVVVIGCVVCLSILVLFSRDFHVRLVKADQGVELLFTTVPLFILIVILIPRAVGLY